ncbi:integrase [Streptomyces sp900116325]|uniref:integrase n=1 Tax=Streptomyces sp. 900116325 TaxID=3154295 RepID=UPI00332FF359
MTNLDGDAIRAWSWNQHYWKKALAAASVISAPPEQEKGSRANLAYGDTREFRYHALCHTCGSVQMDARESVVSVSKWLGHADPSITLKVYAHFMPEADGRGRAALDAWFEGVDGVSSPRFSPASFRGRAWECIEWPRHRRRDHP